MNRGSDLGAPATLFVWLALGAWRQQRGALVAAVLAVSLGVALASGVHLVNRSALGAFAGALATINGQADLRVSARLGPIDDALLEAIEAMPGVRAASPVIETDLRPRADGTEPLRLLAIDPFRAATVNPRLVGADAFGLLADDAILLTEDARQTLGTPTPADPAAGPAPEAIGGADAEAGSPLVVDTPAGPVRLNVVGTIPAARAGERLAMMDIAGAQHRFGMLGQLSRIDLRLVPGTDRAGFAAALRERWPGLDAATPDDAAARMSNLSRAYRVNLNVLALVALLTGAFIVQATMSLTASRLASTFALLGLLGAPATLAARSLRMLALLVGILGAVLGLALGAALAWSLLEIVGADLGGGYFSADRVPLVLEPAALAGFGALGVAASLAGTWGPAKRLRSLTPMRTLRGGLVDPRPDRRVRLRLALALAAVAVALLALPPVAGLALGAYASMALGLLAGIALIGPLLGWLADRLAGGVPSAWKRPAAWLAIARLSDQPGGAAIALSGVVASFALVTAMGVMVHSFRISLDQWLETVLPADIYLRARVSGDLGAFDDNAQAALAALPGVQRVRFLRTRELRLDSDAPPVTVIARELDPHDPAGALPLTGAWLEPATLPAGCVAAYASEPAEIRLGWTPGTRVQLPIGGGACVVIAGVWRDYARQHGALAIPIDHYRRLTGDASVGDASITLTPGASPAGVIDAVRDALGPGFPLEARTAGDIRELSLAIFDRSFALTYALEAIALAVGLFGVVTTYAGEARSRLREFGMLRHLGFTRARITAQFASEAGLAIGVGVLLGAVLGAGLAQVLIHWVNPQSFHWRMSTHWPLLSLAGAGGLLVLIGVAGAALATRSASGTAPILAVRTDW